jgi:GAF domain-containing protein
MASYQSIVENLLLDTGASRAMLVLARPGGGFATVAEAVTHGARQIRNDPPDDTLFDAALLLQLARERGLVVQEDIERAQPAPARVLVERYGVRAQVVAPVIDGDVLAGFVAVHDARGPQAWSAAVLAAVGRAQAAALAESKERAGRSLATTKEDLRDAALQSVLDRVRIGLRVQRCTLRQNVSAAYAFPVTHESRAEGVWSLRGDFTIVQSGQPVIEKMLRDRTQVVQNDTRNASAEPLFHVMLKHYGDMRAQIVTPLFREDSLAAVLSVHSLKELREWTGDEIALAKSAARMLGLLVGATLA